VRQKFAIKDAVRSGVVVTNVDSDSLARKEGIRPGDVITAIDLKPINVPADVTNIMQALTSDGKKSTFLRLHDDRFLELFFRQ